MSRPKERLFCVLEITSLPTLAGRQKLTDDFRERIREMIHGNDGLEDLHRVELKLESSGYTSGIECCQINYDIAGGTRSILDLLMAVGILRPTKTGGAQ